VKRAATYRALTAWAAIALLAGCTGTARPTTPTIEDLRRRAAERPDDPIAQRALAEGELLLPGGDAGAAHAAIQRALSQAPDDVGLRYLHAVERELHGHAADALEAYLELARRAEASDDPLAPTLAEIAVAELEDLDDTAPGFTRRVEEALAPLQGSPRLSDGARAKVTRMLVELAYRRGDVERVRALTAAQRCITEWRVAGPFGPRAWLDFDRELPPDRDATLGDRYDYGPGRGPRDTRTVRARGCAALLGGGPVGGPGITFAESTLELPEAGRWVLRLETPNTVALSIDGQEVARVDRRVEPLGFVTYHPVELAAGAHRVRVEVASQHPNPVVVLSASRTAGPPGGEVEGEGLVAALARVQRAMARGDVVAARELLEPHVGERGSPVFLVAAGAAALNDPLRGSQVRHDAARRLLGWASARDPRAWYPFLALAQLEAAQGRDLEAIQALRVARERWPELVIFPLQLLDLLERRGFTAQADEQIVQAREVAPDACRPRRAALQQARRLSRAAAELEHAEALVACDARSDARLTTLLRRRDWDGARAELARLASLEPEESPVAVLSARLGLAVARGDETEVAEVIARLRERMPQSTGPVLLEVDRALARGDAQAARSGLRAALTTETQAMASLFRVHRALGGDSPIEPYRRDGAEVIRAFEASGRRYDEPMVLVLDYTIHRVFPDGSMLELTHNIYRLQTQEAVDDMGELEVPDGAHMLTLHTIKQDGRRLEPDEIAGKDTLSFPSLAPGDYIEFEYVRPRSAPAGYPGGFIGDRFFFQSFETPYDLSELVVVVPRDAPLAIDPRGPAPRTQESVEEHGGEALRVYRWTARESRPLEREPGSVAIREYLPSIYWGRGATWDLYIESLRDVLADRDMHDPAAARQVRAILGPEAERATPEQRAERIYRWVLENVEDSDDVVGLAPAMLAARSGSRPRVLRYLLGLAGLEADLVLVRSYAADSTVSELPDDDTYANLLVRVRGSQGFLWLYAGQRGAPFGYVPPVLAGMDGLVIASGVRRGDDRVAERVTVAERSLDDDLRTVEVDVELGRDGNARVSVVETMRGATAVLWREQLEGIPEAELRSRFESAYVARLIPGARLRRLTIAGRENPAQPLVFRYEAEVESLARPSRGGWVVPPIYPAMLGPQYAPVASRTTTQLLATGLALDIAVRIRVPEGAALTSVPEEASFEALGASATLRVERSDDAVSVERRFRLPRMRIEPARYGELARFCRSADEAEASEIRIRM
jgi:tetratricopeptide (TPR) repeat protein